MPQNETADAGCRSAANHGVEEAFGFIPRFTVLRTGATYSRLLEAAGAAGSLSLDFPAVNVFLRTGMFLNGATPFREIRRCHPDPVLLAERDGLSRTAAIDGYIDLFRQAVRRRASNACVLALSGGCDSRHILLELHAQKRLPEYAVTIAIPGRPPEVQIASGLARRTGVRHIIYTPDPSRAVDDELWKNQASDFMSLEHGWFACAARKRDSLPWWDGIAGDVLSAGLFLNESNSRMFEEDRLDELAESLVEGPRVPGFRDQELFVREDAVAEVRAELEKHRAAANPVGSFYFWNRTRVTVGASAFGLLRPANQLTLAPFLDEDLWRFLAALPARLLLDHRLHRETVARAYPEFADLPFFENKVKIDGAIYRTKTLRLLRYLGSLAPDLDRFLMALRAARGLVDPRHASGIDHLLPVSVYCTQIRRMLKNDFTAEAQRTQRTVRESS